MWCNVEMAYTKCHKELFLVRHQQSSFSLYYFLIISYCSFLTYNEKHIFEIENGVDSNICIVCDIFPCHIVLYNKVSSYYSLIVRFDDGMAARLEDEDDFIIELQFNNHKGYFDLYIQY